MYNIKQNFTSLLQTTLSAILHQLLHSRAVYPPDIFVIHRYLGVRCHASRVPSVASYIHDFLDVAVPSVVLGITESIVMIVLEEEVVDEGRKISMKVIERFEFKFEVNETISELNYKAEEPKGNSENHSEYIDPDEEKRADAMKRDAQIVNEARIHLEHSMKQCLLGVLSLERRKKRVGEKPQNLSFKLCMRTVDSVNGGTAQKFSKLTEALKNGQWHEPNPSSCLISRESRVQVGGVNGRRGLYRPIKDVKIPTCGMNLSLGMEIG